MATIRGHGSLVPLGDDGNVGVSKDFIDLRFNLQIGTMYVEQEMFSMDGHLSVTILMQKNYE